MYLLQLTVVTQLNRVSKFPSEEILQKVKSDLTSNLKRQEALLKERLATGKVGSGLWTGKLSENEFIQLKPTTLPAPDLIIILIVNLSALEVKSATPQEKLVN